MNCEVPEGELSEYKPSEPKTEFGLKNPSIGNTIWSRNKYTVGSQKGENKISKPINGIWVSKSVWIYLSIF
jgi:hypothetical protein